MTPTHPPTTAAAPRVAPPERPLPRLAGVHHRFVDTPRLRFHVAEAGHGEPVLLLHGWPQHWYGWRKLIPLLAGGYRLICPDLRGFGWTEAPRGGYTTAELVDDLLALLDALGLERVLLIGHDRGGWLGFHLCMRAPERVGRFLALNAVHPWWRVRPMLGQAWRSSYTVLLETTLLGRLVVRRVPAFTRLVLRLGVRDRGAMRPADVEEFVAAVREPARARASERLYHHFAYGEILPTALGRYRSTRLTVPTLMLNGARDFALAPRSPETLRGYEPYADDLRVELVEDGGHFLAEDSPERVAAAARELFDGVEPGQPA